MFLDADDRLTSEAIDKLLDTAYQHNADIVEGAYNVIINDTQIKIGNTHKTGQVDPLFYFEGFPWGKVIKKNIFDLVEFPKGYSYEDSVLKHIVYPLADKSYGIDDVVYLYRQNNEGVSKKLKYQYKSIDSLYIALSLYSDRKKLGIDDTQEYYEYILRNVVLTFKRTALLEKKVRRAIFVIYADFINNCFCEYVTNRNRVLEDIIKTKNYKKYEIWCRLN